MVKQLFLLLCFIWYLITTVNQDILVFLVFFFLAFSWFFVSQKNKEIIPNKQPHFFVELFSFLWVRRVRKPNRSSTYQVNLSQEQAKTTITAMPQSHASSDRLYESSWVMSHHLSSYHSIFNNKKYQKLSIFTTGI